MKYSGVGGQAVMEGVMMRNKDHYAVAVRKPDNEIEIKVSEYEGIIKNKKIRKIPIIRGIISFVESLYLGMSTLMYSASFFEEDDNKKNKDVKEAKCEESKQETIMIALTVATSILLAVGLFFVLPYFVSMLFEKYIKSKVLVAFLEGMVRLVIFLLYISLISFTPDIKRVYMYHGAEHKCINCIEHGYELTVENVRKSSKHHKRCGTSFLILVLMISIIFFMFIQFDSHIVKLLIRLVCIPLIAGVSFEVIQLAGKKDNKFINIISAPGLWMQRITTKEPDDDMIEVGIASVEAVFDWSKWQKEQRLYDL
ncbi:DUF1385 domain-containing protein [Lachnobacterium bovis]|uniref:Uncharacterized conserved protein YqhQ n=1 Tax=Lachnobacterium bovis TaxID=140626 RepID=A0A1H9RI52_9FIRM|nr:DUF1385 domain-containing protein [Lachnobacterium bovis]SER72374.1 Uncharacterized conserved protein YqhQ [Lachnobacterium bovis]